MRPWYRKKRFILGGALLLLVVVIVAASAGTGTDESDTASGNGNGEAATGNGNGDETATDDGGGNDSGVSQGAGSQDAAADVEISECGISDDGLEWGEATVSITNNSSGRSDYWITVVWESEDGSTRHTDTPVIANQIEPGQSTTEVASAFEEVPEDAVCRVTEVQRTASN